MAKKIKITNIFITIISIIILIIIFLKEYIVNFKIKDESFIDKYKYSIEVKESLEYSNSVISIGEDHGQHYYINNLDEVFYKDDEKKVFIMESLKKGYLTLNVLKFNMKIVETDYGELYKYDGTGIMGTSRFSIFIFNDSVVFSTYDYMPKDL